MSKEKVENKSQIDQKDYFQGESKLKILKSEVELAQHLTKIIKRDNIFYEIISQAIEFHNAYVSYKKNNLQGIEQKKYSIYTMMFLENYLNSFTRYKLSDPEAILNV